MLIFDRYPTIDYSLMRLFWQFVSIQLPLACLFLCNAPLHAQQLAQLAGIISNRQGSVEGVDIQLIGTDKRAKTEADGSFELAAAPGTYTLKATLDGYLPLEQTVTLDVARPVQKVLVMESRFDATLNPEVVTATRSSEYAIDAPATVYVITADQIAMRGYTHLQDVLEDIPEVEIQRNASEEFRDFMSLRGIFGNEKFMILLDGVQISVPTGEPTYVGRNYSVLNAKRVEVILGPASALYGVDAFAGIINIITRDGAELSGANGRISYGRFGTVEGGGSAGFALKNAWKFSVTGQGYTSQEANFPALYPNDFSWYNQYLLPNGLVLNPFPDSLNNRDTLTLAPGIDRTFALPSEAYFLNARASFRSLEVGVTRHYTRHSSSYGAMPNFTLYNKDAIYGTALTNVYARHALQGGKKVGWELSSLGWYSAFRAIPGSNFINNYSGFTSGYKYQESNTFRLQELFTLTFSKQFNLAVGGQIDRFEALAKTADLPSPYQFGTNAEDQGQYYPGTNIKASDGRSLLIPMQYFRPRYSNYGIYSQVRWADKQQVAEVTAGLRMDYNTRYGAIFNPRMGLVVTPLSGKRENLKLKAMYGEAFLAPSPWKAESHFGSFSPDVNAAGDTVGLTAGFWHLPNPNLEPEKLRTGEFSVIGKLGKGLLLSVNGYYNEVRNLITQFGSYNPADSLYPGNVFQGVTVGYIEMTVNQGTQTTYGATFRANYVRDFGIWTVDAFGSYSFTDGNIESDAMHRIDLPFIAHHTIKGGISLTDRRFSISPRVLYRSHTKGNGTNTFGQTFESPGFWVVNLHTQYSFLLGKGNQKLTVFARINNLLDNRYYNVFFGGPTGLASVPQDPLRWNIGLMVDLK